jgi:hypothetical protein
MVGNRPSGSAPWVHNGSVMKSMRAINSLESCWSLGKVLVVLGLVIHRAMFCLIEKPNLDDEMPD